MAEEGIRVNPPNVGPKVMPLDSQLWWCQLYRVWKG